MPVGPLQPGTYIIESDRDISPQQLQEISGSLRQSMPLDVKFVILSGGLHLARTEAERQHKDEDAGRDSQHTQPTMDE